MQKYAPHVMAMGMIMPAVMIMTVTMSVCVVIVVFVGMGIVVSGRFEGQFMVIVRMLNE